MPTVTNEVYNTAQSDSTTVAPDSNTTTTSTTIPVTTTTPTTTSTTVAPIASGSSSDVNLQQIVPYKPQTSPLTFSQWKQINPNGTTTQYNSYKAKFNPQTGLINIADYTGQVALDPSLALPAGSQLSTQVPTFTQDQTNAGLMDQQAGMGDLQADTAQVAGTEVVGEVDPQAAVGYDAALSEDQVAANEMTAAQGALSSGSIIDINGLQIDLNATAEGTNAIGAALKDFAFLDPDDVDARATLVGQMELLQSQFFDGDGNPTIPPWAAGVARNVQKIAAFKGITGTAATAAMSNALLEGTVQIAQQDAQFFQTLTLQNLDNKQKSIIQRAAVLANMDMANLDSRTNAAIQNSKNFLQMDLANLNNEQQAAVINNQARIQSILEDVRAENTARLFLATNENDLNKFYDSLNASIEQYNASQVNGMNQFNAQEANSMNQFNTSLEDSRDKFYREMAYNIDIANAKWRQTISTTENQYKFEAAALDVKNKVAITQEALNRLWDRADALLDYTWKSGENQLDRNAALVIAKLQSSTTKTVAQIQADVNKSNQPGFLDIIGSIAGTLLGRLF